MVDGGCARPAPTCEPEHHEGGSQSQQEAPDPKDWKWVSLWLLSLKPEPIKEKLPELRTISQPIMPSEGVVFDLQPKLPHGHPSRRIACSAVRPKAAVHMFDMTCHDPASRIILTLIILAEGSQLPSRYHAQVYTRLRAF